MSTFFSVRAKSKASRGTAAATTLSLVSLLAALTACGSFDLGDKRPTEVAVDVDNPVFSADIKPLMAIKCMGCHADPLPKHAPKGSPTINLAEEGTFKKNANRVWLRVFTTTADPMPPEFGTPVTTAERVALKTYLKSIGVDTTTAAKPSSTPATSGASGSSAGSLSTKYFDQCAGCHGNNGEGSGNSKKLAGTALSQSAFLAKVRAGGNGMPTDFTAAKIPDATVNADYAVFKSMK